MKGGCSEYDQPRTNDDCDLLWRLSVILHELSQCFIDLVRVDEIKHRPFVFNCLHAHSLGLSVSLSISLQQSGDTDFTLDYLHCLNITTFVLLLLLFIYFYFLNIIIVRIYILFLETFHYCISIYFCTFIVEIFIFYQSITLSFDVKRFELRKETAIYVKI